MGQGIKFTCTSFVATGRADLMDNDSIDDLLEFEPPWREELVRWRRQQADTFVSTTTVPPLRLVLHLLNEVLTHLGWM